MGKSLLTRLQVISLGDCSHGGSVTGTRDITATALDCLASKRTIQSSMIRRSALSIPVHVRVSTSGANTVVCSFTGASGSGGTAGCITPLECLASPDANDNVELTYTTGSYPNLTGTSYAGTVVPVVESVN